VSISSYQKPALDIFFQRREKAIRDMLLRAAPKLDEWMTRGMAGSLKIPLSWINEAKVIQQTKPFQCHVQES
jgi:hypothetical protein